jgi:hypothetical protein
VLGSFVICDCQVRRRVSWSKKNRVVLWEMVAADGETKGNEDGLFGSGFI